MRDFMKTDILLIVAEEIRHLQ